MLWGKNKVALMLVITLLFNIFYTSNVFATFEYKYIKCIKN